MLYFTALRNRDSKIVKYYAELWRRKRIYSLDVFNITRDILMNWNI